LGWRVRRRVRRRRVRGVVGRCTGGVGHLGLDSQLGPEEGFAGRGRRDGRVREDHDS